MRIGPKRGRPFFLHIAEWRDKRGLTQQQLADRLGVSDVTVSRWETRRRKPDRNAQAAICEALDITLRQLERHPDRPAPEELLTELLKDQPQEVWDQAIKIIQAIRK